MGIGLEEADEGREEGGWEEGRGGGREEEGEGLGRGRGGRSLFWTVEVNPISL